MCLLVSSASAADLTILQSGIVEAPSGASWDGGYIGLNVGAGSGLFSFDDFDYDINVQGWLAGAQAGYNFSIGNDLVLGIEGNLNVADETGSFVSGPYTDSAQIDWTGSLTGHLGVAINNIMPYVLGGVAVAHVNENDGDTSGAPPYTGHSEATHVGYTVGVGVAAMLTDNISGFAEARYADYGSAAHDYSSTDGFTGTFDAGLTEASVRIGVNMHFN
jgi:outer membrane immunogenic protein